MTATRHLLLAAALVAAAAHKNKKNDSKETRSSVARIVMFKRGRTGSTWMADLLKSQAAVAFWEHEANGCLKGLGSLDNLRAMGTMVAAPACHMECRNYHTGPKTGVKHAADPNVKHELPAWVRGKKHLPPTEHDTPECLRGKLVGFDVQAEKEYPSWPGQPEILSWKDHWGPLLQLHHVKLVVYVRTNTVKYAVSRLHVHELVRLCNGDHKVNADHPGATDCYERNKEELSRALHVDPDNLLDQAAWGGRMWVDLLEKAKHANSGQRFLIMYYEALQTDTEGELQRLFRYAGLPKKTITLDTSNTKITDDDLRHVLANFSHVEAAVARQHPCLLGQLCDTNSAVFRTICLADGVTGSFGDYEV